MIIPPIILITGGREKDSVRLPEAYSRAVESAGGVPLLLPPGAGRAAVKAAVMAARGLLLPGGGDVAPSLFAQKPHPRTGEPDPGRDEVELAAVGAAREKGIPILGICRGAQLLNVAFGGSLFQHIPDLRLKPSVTHRGEDASHKIRVAEDSLLRRILGQTELLVNSTHHQAIDRIGRGLKASAYAEDGIVEAVESSAGLHVVGIQCHPERLIAARPEFQRLFGWLIGVGQGKSNFKT